MKYCVREDRGLRTVDVAVPGTSTYMGELCEYYKTEAETPGLVQPEEKETLYCSLSVFKGILLERWEQTFLARPVAIGQGVLSLD